MEGCYNYWAKKKLEDELSPEEQEELKDLMNDNNNKKMIEKIKENDDIHLRSIMDCTKKRRFFK